MSGGPILLAVTTLSAGCAKIPTMRCPDRFESVSDAVSSLDRDGDGLLSERDVERGESVLVLSFTQENGKERVVVSRDAVAIILSHVWEGGDEREPPEWGPRSLFGVWHEFTECSESGWITPWFVNEAEEQPHLASGTGGVYRVSFDIASIEHGNFGLPVDSEGQMVVVREGREASGHLEGRVSSEIKSYMTQRLTGERAVLLAHAFRGLPVDVE